MLIERIRLSGHPGIGDVDLDLCDEGGNPAPVVVLAGANGTGKTTLLKAIHHLFDPQPGYTTKVEIDVFVDGREGEEINKQLRSVMYDHTGSRFTLIREPRALIKARTALAQLGAAMSINIGEGSSPHLKSLFSAAYVNFTTPQFTGVGGNDFDSASWVSREGQASLGTEIGQLLIDIRSADAEELQDWVENHPGDVPSAEVVHRRAKRFQRAIDFMMPYKRLAKLIRKNDRIEIGFEDTRGVTTYDKLSTGEQQIIVRGGFLFRNAATIGDAVVLIDEPELSLHPDWQVKIIDFYRYVLSDLEGRHPQIILATHSPFVVHSASAGKVIVLERDTAGIVREMVNPVYPGVSPSVAVRAFNLERFVREVQPGRLIVITEGATDASIIETAWAKLNPPDTTMPFKAEPGMGASQLQGFLNGPGMSSLAESGKVVGLFDYDQEGVDRWGGVWMHSGEIVDGTAAAGLLKRHMQLQAWAMLLPVPPYRANMAGPQFEKGHKLAIELMFDNTAIPENMREEKMQVGNVAVTVFTGDKKAFAEHVKKLAPECFAAFQPLFKRLIEISEAPPR